MVVQSLGQLESLTPPPPTWQYAGGALNLYGAYQTTYLQIYQTQPNVRTMVDFLARNVAQLGLHHFRRVSDTDRVRLTDYPAQTLIDYPNASTTRYRLIEALMQDLGIYFNAYWLKVRSKPMALVRLPPAEMHVEGTLLPTGFVWTTADGNQQHFAPSEIVVFSGYGAGLMGLSPLETLRRTLAEEAAAGDYRQQLWRNAGRVEGVIERPRDAPKWTPVQKQSWREQWQAAYAAGGSRPGSVAILEDGMSFKNIGFNARDMEYAAARKLAKTECASAYMIPPPMVGDLEHATFSNIVEQRKSLYQDTLGPWLEMIQAEWERQVLPEFGTDTSIYCEFNLAEKLKGAFEQQATSLRLLVGRPVMTANEGRARLNLPRIEDDPSADQLAAQQGGPADATGVPAGAMPVAVDVIPVIAAHHMRQAERLRKVPVIERGAVFARDLERWTTELATDLTPITGDVNAVAIARRVNAETLARLEAAAAAALPHKELES